MVIPFFVPVKKALSKGYYGIGGGMDFVKVHLSASVWCLMEEKGVFHV
jgi:hypothetical protein